MNASQVRGIIDRMEAETRSRAARRKLAAMGIEFGNITDEGKDVYRRYIELLDADE